MKFELPTPSKTVAAATDKAYRAKLNLLAASGYSTVESLKKDPTAVIDLIETKLAVNDEVVISEEGEIDFEKPEKDKRRVHCLFYSAIFYAIGKQDFTQHPELKAYQDAFRSRYYTESYPKS